MLDSLCSPVGFRYSLTFLNFDLVFGDFIVSFKGRGEALSKPCVMGRSRLFTFERGICIIAEEEVSNGG